MEHLKTSLLVMIAVAAGCGSFPKPTEKMISAEAAIRGAQEVGAAKVPEAQLHVKLAQEQIDKAKQLMGDNENQRAEALLIRAQSDAELALALSKEASAKSEAQKALEEVKSLKDKLK